MLRVQARVGALRWVGGLGDPRHFQLLVQVALVAHGLFALDFDLGATGVVTALASALAAQLAPTRALGLPRFDPRSALSSAFSLCLLLRASSPAWIALAAAVSILSKFVVRTRGRHVVNPTAFGIVMLLVVAPNDVWVSPAQWGTAATLGYSAVYLAFLAVRRPRHADLTVTFLGAQVALLFSRAWWLGDPWSIPVHQVVNGMTLLFAFSMISDPKTTPVRRSARVAFAVAVALGAYLVRFGFYANNGLLYSLVAASLAVRLVEHLLPADVATEPSPAPLRGLTEEPTP